MSQPTSAHNEILQGPILPPLIRFALPLMLSLLLQALYGAVDLAVVGKFSSTASTAAVATGSQMMQSVTSLITGLTMGVTILIGKAAGAGDFQQAGRIAAGQIKLFSAVAILLTGLVTVFAPLCCQWMHVPANALEQTIAYIRICAGGMVFITAFSFVPRKPAKMAHKGQTFRTGVHVFSRRKERTQRLLTGRAGRHIATLSCSQSIRRYILSTCSLHFRTKHFCSFVRSPRVSSQRKRSSVS